MRLWIQPFDGEALKLNGTARVVTPAAGAVRESWVAAEVDTAGVFTGRFEDT